MLTYEEVEKDLFTVEEKYWLAHCVSADFALGGGIALEFARRFNERNFLISRYGRKYFQQFEKFGHYCLVDENAKVFNLVTKKNVYDLPTYASLTGALKDLQEECNKFDVEYLAMPLIGCGLDRLNWKRVSQIIQDTFAFDDINILICVRR